MARMWKRRIVLGVALTIVLAVLGGRAIGQNPEVLYLDEVEDLDLSGNIIYAVNFGNNGNPTIGGITFSQDEDHSTITLDVLGEGPATWWGPSPGTDDAGLNQLMDGFAYRYGTAPLGISIDVTGLGVGQSYLLQIISYEPEDHSRNIDFIVENEEIVAGFDPFAQQGGANGQGGYLIKYEFIATDPILNISLLSHLNACGLSGFILTQLASLPDFNSDWKVDIEDLLILIEHWGTDEPSVDIAPTPLGDGIVDAQDLEVLMSYWDQEITDPSLLAYWKLDETEGNIACDSARANDAIVLGEAVWMPDVGIVDGALWLDGKDDGVAADFILNPADGPFTILAWIKGGLPGQVIISQANGADWLLADAAEGALMTSLAPSQSRSPKLFSQSVVTDGHWHRVALVYDGSGRTLYVDDVPVAQDTQANLPSCEGGLNIGCGANLESGTFFSGLIDDVRIYNRVVQP